MMLAQTKDLETARTATAPPPLSEAVFWIGRLGGHPCRKSDLPCGPLRLHRGLRQAHTLAHAWQLFSPNNEPKNEPKTSD
ncbi:MAG: hypothetical protein LBD14_03190 [Puniceicoccales bacterium]|nr:hypothetical protein [Puniceicoccales bacterium]